MKIESMKLPETVSFKVDDIEFHSYVTGGLFTGNILVGIHWHGQGGLKYLSLQSLGSSLSCKPKGEKVNDYPHEVRLCS